MIRNADQESGGFCTCGAAFNAAGAALTEGSASDSAVRSENPPAGCCGGAAGRTIPVGTFPTIDTRLTVSDIVGGWKVRWGIGRMNYRIDPGLYAVGSPDDRSPVLVTANYKLSFDAIRSQLGGRNAWILVLETFGINVWCAAGKGTFGTDELVRRIEAVGLANVVTHSTVILPQLGAPGVGGHIVKRKSGFRVVYGPVRARDIGAFLDAGMKADPEMRLVRFDLGDRAAIIPVELVLSLKIAVAVALGFFVLSGLSGRGLSIARMLSDGFFPVIMVFSAVIAGTVIAPLLLPWLPGRAFSLKGLWLGLAATGLETWVARVPGYGVLSTAAWFLIAPALISFVVMNLTGTTTFTSLSGVRKELRISLPLQAAAGGIGMLVWIAGRFIS